jgi:phage baseplate assembly protein V
MSLALDTMNRLLAPLRTRLANMVGRAVVSLADDSAKLQLLQLAVLDGETRSACERFQQYGLTSHPFPGAEAVVLFVGGRRDHGLVVAVDDRRYRKAGLEEGEVALYTDEGDYVLLSRGRVVEVKAGTKVRVNAPAAEFTGNVTIAGALEVAGAVTAKASLAVAGAATAASVAATGAIAAGGTLSDSAGSMATMRTKYNAHTHTAPSGGGATGTPSQSM